MILRNKIFKESYSTSSYYDETAFRNLSDYKLYIGHDINDNIIYKYGKAEYIKKLKDGKCFVS